MSTVQEEVSTSKDAEKAALTTDKPDGGGGDVNLKTVTNFDNSQNVKQVPLDNSKIDTDVTSEKFYQKELVSENVEIMAETALNEELLLKGDDDDDNEECQAKDLNKIIKTATDNSDQALKNKAVSSDQQTEHLTLLTDENVEEITPMDISKEILPRDDSGKETDDKIVLIENLAEEKTEFKGIYKETLIDDDDDSDFELVYKTDDEMQTDEVLNLLDKELGLTDDSKSTENNGNKFIENSRHDENMIVSDITEQEIENRNGITEMSCDITNNDKIDDSVTKPDEEEEEMILPDLQREADISMNQGTSDLNIKAIISDIKEQEFENQHDKSDNTNIDKIKENVTKPDEEEEMILPDTERQTGIYIDNTNQDTAYLNIKVLVSDIKQQEIEKQDDKAEMTYDNTTIDKIVENVTKPDEEEEMILPDIERQPDIRINDTNQDKADLNIKEQETAISKNDGDDKNVHESEDVSLELLTGIGKNYENNQNTLETVSAVLVKEINIRQNNGDKTIQNPQETIFSTLSVSDKLELLHTDTSKYDEVDNKAHKVVLSDSSEHVTEMQDDNNDKIVENAGPNFIIPDKEPEFGDKRTELTDIPSKDARIKENMKNKNKIIGTVDAKIILETEMIETKDKEAVPEVSKDLVDWDDDDVMETDIQPLSDDALKRLDEELDITETNTTVTEQFGDAKDIVPKDSKITESSDQKPDSQNVPTEKNVEEVTSMDICEEILPDIVYSKSKEIVEKNLHIENIAEEITQIDTKVIPDFISMEVNIEKKNLEETSVENKTEDSARMDEDIPKQDDEKVEGKEIHETDKNINLVTEVDITPKIRVLNVAEINYENKMKESIDCDNAEEAPIVNDDGVLNISVERNEIIIDATTVLTEKEFITPDLANDSTSIGIKTDHKINRPDVMIDIPTRELIDFEDDEIMKSDDKRDVYSLTGKTVTEIVSQLAETSTKINTSKDKDQTDSTTVEKTDEVVNQKPESPKNTLETAKNQDGDNKKAESEATDLQKIIKTEKDAASNEASKNQVENQPSTSKSTDDTKVTSTDPKTVSEDPKESLECQKMIPDEEAIEDTLDLLAESSIVPDDDEEQEPEVDDDDDDGNGDDDDEIDPDDESNQMTTAEHSEDSNSNTDQAQETDTEQNFLKVTEGVPQSVIGDQSETSLDVVSDSNAEIELVSDSNDANEFNEDVEDVLKKEEKVSEKLEAMLKTTISGVESVSKTRRRSILLELLTKIDDEDGEENSRKIKRTQKQDTNIVDLGESDSEEDIQVKKSKKIDIPSAGDKKLDTSPQDEQSDAKKDEEDDDKAKEKENKVIEAILDSDSDEDLIAEDVPPLRNNICINNNCTSDDSVQYYIADKSCKSYYRVARGRGAVVCQYCMEFVNNRNRNLVSGIKDLRPLIELEMSSPHQQLVEISDSESDEDDGDTENRIEKDTADLLEDQLEEVFNCTWRKYNMDERLRDTEDYLKKELEKLNAQSKDVGELLKNCENETDALRNAFYLEFEPKKHALAALYIHDTPIASYFCPEKDEKAIESSSRYPKRQASTTIETPAKKQAMVKDFASPETDQTKQDDDDKDVSVVHLSAEEAPAHLPPPGEVVRAPLAAGMAVYAMKNSFGAWLRGKLLEVCGKLNGFTQCRIRFEHNIRNTCKVLSARSIAYTEPSDVRLTIGTRVVALFKTEYGDLRKDAYYSGVVAEIPNPVNNYRYLVFFDDGYAQYVPHQHTRLVAESSDHVWEEVHPFSRDFVYNYLLKYPERPMVRMHQGQTISVELNGKWYETRVVKVDASLVQVLFLEENRTEWIYRGSTRLRPLFVEIQAAQGAGSRARLPRSTRNNSKLNNVPYVEYTRSEEQTNKNNVPQQIPPITEEQRRLRAVAKKSTGPAPIPASTPSDGVTSRVVYYTPKHAVRPHKLSPHTCGPRCRRTDLLSLKELRTYNPLAKPLLSGWERQIVRMKAGRREVMYRAPCGRRVRNMSELHRYLSALRSDLSVDLFDFNPSTHCLAEFVLTKYNVGKKDLSHGQENVPVACVNYYDTTLPEFCTYNTERTPTAGVPLNLDPEFLCGCDCTDDCVDKSKCACWQMTLEGARTIGMEGPNIGYQYRRLLEPLPTGIYECNSRCKCKNTCLNRVAQHPLQLKLQVFKTINRGWGIRALNDVPKGAFLCIYAGNLLTDATANLDGLNEGDEYLAELDYIEVVEGMKEGYEEDVVEPDSKSDKKDKSSENEESENEKSEEEDKSNDNEDVDFLPGSIGLGLTEFSKRLRKRNKKKNKEDSTEKDGDNQNKKEGDDCITISDDDEVREPARFTAQEGMKDKKIVPKYASVRDYFGKDEACYIMDAKVQGNIGRYLNHSCSPNVFVQNVFVDTHDPRFPWVSFFALHHIRAGTELTWNYNYDVGSVPGKVLYCFCGAGNCRGRLL